MRHTPRPSRIVRLGDTNIHRVEIYTQRWWQSSPRWTPLRYWRWGDELVPWEGTYKDAVKRHADFIATEWEVVYREEDNWMTVESPRCEGTCNPHLASCGARFCTYEEMTAHRCGIDN